MKNAFILSILFVFLSIQLSIAQSKEVNDIDYLEGEWILDMSPEISSDENFAYMNIDHIENGNIVGEFYREGVKMRNGKINSQTEVIYAALISGDNSGEYYSSFYLKEGILYGSTHAIGRDFLAVWTATKRK